MNIIQAIKAETHIVRTYMKYAALQWVLFAKSQIRRTRAAFIIFRLCWIEWVIRVVLLRGQVPFKRTILTCSHFGFHFYRIENDSPSKNPDKKTIDITMGITPGRNKNINQITKAHKGKQMPPYEHKNWLKFILRHLRAPHRSFYLCFHYIGKYLEKIKFYLKSPLFALGYGKNLFFLTFD